METLPCLMQQRRIAFLLTLAIGFAISSPCFAQSTLSVQKFALSDASDLTLVDVKAAPVEYLGRKAVRITKDDEKGGFALVRGTDFQDGIIEVDIALKTTTPPGVRMPGFVGIAFRAKPDASRFELFYLRPGNSTVGDQAMRNHTVQYTSEPDFDWFKLRRTWPWVYETHADLKLETWMRVKIEVKGRTAKLFLNGSDEPSLIVDGLKGQDLKGGIALWGYAGEESYFSNLRITNLDPAPVKNGSDASGEWQVTCATDVGPIKGTLTLARDGAKITGKWSGDLGEGVPVSGTWRDGYVELSFPAEWKFPESQGQALATLAGWIDGDSAGGRMKVATLTDGRWMATRKK